MYQVMNKNGLIAALDIGTSKVCCVLAKPESDGTLSIAGAGMHQNKGVSNGRISDLEKTVACIGAAVDAAEATGGAIEKVFSNALIREIDSFLIKEELVLPTGDVGEEDLVHLRTLAQNKIVSDSREILHCFPVSYSLDDNKSLNDPRGLCGERLGIILHTILCEKNPLRNEYKAIERCHLRCAGTVAAPYATGLACLSEEERTQGAAVIDLGEGSTGIGVFKDSQLIYATNLPVSCSHITKDIMFGLNTSFAQAERLKLLKGAAFSPQSYAFEEITVTPPGDDFPSYRTRRDLTEIIIPRTVEIFEHVQKTLKKQNLDKTCHNFVLTGGGSQLQSIRELASETLKANVRLGVPVGINDKSRLIPRAAYPLYMGSFGLLKYAAQSQTRTALKRDFANGQNKFLRFFQWFLDNC